jgi:hypothetical protein
MLERALSFRFPIACGLRLTLKSHAVGGIATSLWKIDFLSTNGVRRVFSARAFLLVTF